MLWNTAVGLLLVSTIVSVSGQTTSDSDAAAQFSAKVVSLIAIPSVSSAIAAEASELATNPALLAALSSVPGISTKNIAADLNSAIHIVGTATASELRYLGALPSTGSVATLLNTAIGGVLYPAISDHPELFSIAEPTAVAGTGSQASGFATSTGAAETGSQASGVARSTGAAVGTGSQASGAAQSTGARSTGGVQTTAAPTSSQAGAQSSTAPRSSAPQPQSTSSSTGGVASQPTGVIIAAGAAAAGVLGFAAML